ncbi:MAG TPA: M1 family peptidase [Bacteroidetes bacterium]|nr:M1 family peptidase [Bacteroidota bacterium]
MKNLLQGLALTAFLFVATFVQAQESYNNNKFRQLYQELPTPNVYRTASGAPGHAYYQQQADYQMDIVLDDINQIIRGKETITYHNNSPDPLSYLWLQLDQNVRAQGSDRQKLTTGVIENQMNFGTMKRVKNNAEFDGGFKLEYVKDSKGKALPHQVIGTMMRVDLSSELKSGDKFSLSIKWWYNVNDRDKLGGRSGLEFFPDENNYLYTIAQFFPRMAVYNEVEGWQHKQFLGRGEFTLPFGNYKVNLTVPDDHIVGATGMLQNADKVLTSAQRNRLKEARTASSPVMIVTPDEALKNEKNMPKGSKTWTFQAENVRDFAFCSSKKFIWDAIGVKFGNRTVMAMSYYPKEGNPLWERYSTKVVAHTIRTYSKYTIDYPYPVAISVHTDRIGMEYPMICFNGGRPEADGTYSERTKYGMISVIIHEVGHNFFPMIINSDERQWTWMDEGLNTFVQYLTEKEWDRDYPSRRGPAAQITDYMKGDKAGISPIMTNSESIFQFGNNAYGKPATALNILRETVMGRELFDFAFKEYARRWAFRHPSPADFFRTIEDASAIDLDWFWRGWFFTNEHVDLALDDVQWYRIDSKNPEVEAAKALAESKRNKVDVGIERNKKAIPQSVIELDPTLVDFYNKYDPLAVSVLDKEDYQYFLSQLEEDELAILNGKYNYYQLSISNQGGLPMPVILEFEFKDGSKKVSRIPAEIWRFGAKSFNKVYQFEKEVVAVQLDPFQEIADVNLDNNSWPAKVQPSRFKLYKDRNHKGENPMQRDQRAQERSGGSN